MSGSDIKPADIGFLVTRGKGAVNYPIHHRISINPQFAAFAAAKDMPKDVWSIQFMQTDDPFIGTEDWADTVRDIIKKHEKTVIVSTDANYGKMLEYGALDAVIGQKRFEITGAAGRTEQFANATPKATLWTNEKTVTGLNIFGQAMIMIAPTLSPNAMIQASKRIIRPDNTYRTVYIYVLCGTERSYLTSYYAKAFSYFGWPYGHDETANVGAIEKVVALLRRTTNITFDDVSRVDLVILMASYIKIMEDGRIKPKTLDALQATIIKWWKENLAITGESTILDEQAIRDIVYAIV